MANRILLDRASCAALAIASPRINRGSLRCAACTITSQGQAWDQISLARYDSEKQMHVLLPANVDEMDTLLFEGGLSLAVPDVQPLRVKSLPPWERM